MSEVPPPPANAGDASADAPRPELEIPPDVIRVRYILGSDPQLEQAVAQGSVVIGRFSVYSRWRSHLSFVKNPLFGKQSVVVKSMENKGDALHNDIVAVELIGEQAVDGEAGEDAAEDAAPMPLTLPDGRQVVRAVQYGGPRAAAGAAHASAPEVRLSGEMHAPERYDWQPGTQKLGRVVRVLSREMKPYHVARLADGVLKPGQPVQSHYNYRFVLYDALQPSVVVQGRDIPAMYYDKLDSCLFLLRLQSQPSGLTVIFNGDLRKANFHSMIGDAENAEVNALVISNMFDIPPERFAAEVEECVPDEMPIPTAEELRATGRRDLREEEFVCTIDPATARDLDDALSIRRSKRGGYHVGVHIADVSHFVRPDTALDAEAARRCTSTYFVDHVVPMLPRKLSEDYCSLNPSEDKFAFSSLFELDRDGHVVSEWFGQSVIRSRCRLAYEEAQRIIDGERIELDVGRESELTGAAPEQLRERVYESVKLLFEVASKRRAESLDRGRLALGNSRLAFVYDEASGGINSRLAPVGFYVSRQIEANWVVEEFMLLANARTAEKIVQFLPDGALLRCHPAPKREKLRKLRDALREHHIHFNDTSAKGLQRTLDEARTSQHYDSLCTLMKYTLQAAKYIANDPTATDSRAHFALGLPWYTHFTSPIRRYCDIIAHRQLLAAVELEALMVEDGIDLPARPGLLQERANGANAIPAAARLYSPDELKHGRYVYDPSDIVDITARANINKENARKASDQSLQLFFCLYLLALKRKAEVDPSIDAVQRTVVSVLEIKDASLRLYSTEVASEVVIGLHDNKQAFSVKTEEEPAEEDDNEDKDKDSDGDDNAAAKERQPQKTGGGAPTRKRDIKEKARRTNKGGKADLPARPQHAEGEVNGKDKDPETVTLLWDTNPPGGEKEEEVISLFCELVVELHPIRQSGCLQLFMKIVPPAERAAYYASGKTVPTSLV